MRVAFLPPSEEEFLRLFANNGLKGAGFSDIRTPQFYPPNRSHQRGAGFFSTLANIAKSAAPFLIRNIAPSAMHFASGVFDDLSTGNRKLKDSLKKRGIDAVKEIGRRVMKGGGRKKKKKARSAKRISRKKKKKKTVAKNKKCNIKDVFSML